MVRRWSADTMLNGQPFTAEPLSVGDCLSVGTMDLVVVPPAESAAPQAVVEEQATSNNDTDPFEATVAPPTAEHNAGSWPVAAEPASATPQAGDSVPKSPSVVPEHLLKPWRDAHGEGGQPTQAPACEAKADDDACLTDHLPSETSPDSIGPAETNSQASWEADSPADDLQAQEESSTRCRSRSSRAVDRAAMTARVKRLTAALREAKLQVATSQQRVAHHDADLSSLQLERTQLANSLSDAQVDLENSTAKADQLEQEIQSLRSQLVEAETHVFDLRGAAMISDSRLQEFEEEAASLQIVLDERDEQLSAQSERIDSLEAAIVDLEQLAVTAAETPQLQETLEPGDTADADSNEWASAPPVAAPPVAAPPVTASAGDATAADSHTNEQPADYWALANEPGTQASVAAETLAPNFDGQVSDATETDALETNALESDAPKSDAPEFNDPEFNDSESDLPGTDTSASFAADEHAANDWQAEPSELEAATAAEDDAAPSDLPTSEPADHAASPDASSLWDVPQEPTSADEADIWSPSGELPQEPELPAQDGGSFAASSFAAQQEDSDQTAAAEPADELPAPSGPAGCSELWDIESSNSALQAASQAAAAKSAAADSDSATESAADFAAANADAGAQSADAWLASFSAATAAATAAAEDAHQSPATPATPATPDTPEELAQPSATPAASNPAPELEDAAAYDDSPESELSASLRAEDDLPESCELPAEEHSQNAEAPVDEETIAEGVAESPSGLSEELTSDQPAVLPAEQDETQGGDDAEAQADDQWPSAELTDTPEAAGPALHDTLAGAPPLSATLLREALPEVAQPAPADEQPAPAEEPSSSEVAPRLTAEDLIASEQPVSESPASFIEKYADMLPPDDEAADSPPVASGVSALESLPPAADVAAHEGSGEDDSIDDYMASLMQRIRGESASDMTPAPVATVASLASPAATPAQPTPAPMAKDETPLTNLDTLKSGPAPERSRDMSALRDLANQSARSAIGVAANRQNKEKALANVVISGMAMACGGFLAVTAPSLLSAQFMGGLISFGLAGYWGSKTLRHMFAANGGGEERPRSNPVESLPIDGSEGE